MRDDGAAALTVRRIAELAGCSTTGIYTHFGGKHGLVTAIYLQGFDSFDDALFPAYKAGDLLLAGRRYREWAHANPMHYLVMFGRAVPDFEPDESTVERAGRSFLGLIDALAAAGAPEPSRAALHVYATVHGYVMLELTGFAPPGLDTSDYYQRGLVDTLHQVLHPSTSEAESV